MAIAKKYGQIQEERSKITFSTEVFKMKETLMRDKTNPKAWFDLGTAYAEQCLFREAEEAMSEAISYSPFFVAAFVKKGGYEISLGRFDEAAGDLAMATHLDPSDANAWKLFGIALYLSGVYHRAWRALEFAVTRGGEDEAKLWFALSLLQIGETKKSGEIAGQVKDCDACAILSGRMDLQTALAKARSGNPHDRVVLVYTSARYLAVNGRTDEAEKVLRMLVPDLDAQWWGYFENAVRAALKMDAVVRCVR